MMSRRMTEDWETHFVRACAVEVDMDRSQEPFCMENYRKNAGPQSRKTVKNNRVVP